MREAIIEAAVATMIRPGLAAGSIAESFDAAGTEPSRLNDYFAGTPDLIAAIINRHLNEILAAQPALDRIDSWEGIDAWVDEVMRDYRSQGPVSCPLGSIPAELRNDDSIGPALDAAVHRWETSLTRGLTKIRDRGELGTDADPARLATIVIAALQGGVLMAGVHDDGNVLLDVLLATVRLLRSWSPTV